MSSRAALSGDPALTRVLVLDGDDAHEVFDVLSVSASLARVRSAWQFEVGEQLRVRIERDGASSVATARVRGHVGPPDARITELELVRAGEPG